MSSMATLVANRSGRAETVVVSGREYVKSAVTLIVPGVLNGSSGPLLYPADEVARNPGRWNGVPVTLGHPTRNGVPVSASAAGVPRVGRVQDVAFRNGALRGVAWFDAGELRRLSPRLLSDLKAGKTISISTGLYTTDERVANGVHTDGRRYVAVARNYQPDHLAVLLDQRGACSVSDGCGLNVNSRRTTAMRTRHDDYCRCTTCLNARGGYTPPLVANCGRDGYDDDDYKPKPMDLQAITINWQEAKEELDRQQKVRRD